jgi:N-acyl-phosphatidylethanolamine-hydrolysing phospholipase D
MKRFSSTLIRPLFCFLLLLSLTCGLFAQRSLAHHREDGFTNTDPNYKEPSFTKLAPYLFGRFTDLLSRPKADVAFTYNDGTILRQNRPYTITWIGHTTLLIQIEGKNILTDPVWSARVGPVSWVGAPRVSEPGIALEKLPPIDIVLISNNQYDHLDENTILTLAKNPRVRFFVPLRVRDWFEDRGISNVEELDWWEGVTFKDLKIVSSPSQCISGRWLTDRNETLWCSWIILGKRKRIYYNGDSGYFSGFTEIGNRFGPFDLSILPIGGYEPHDLLKPIRMNPVEAVQASLDLRSMKTLGIRWGTFKQTEEAIDEPPKKFNEEVARRKLPEDSYWLFMLGDTRDW